MNFVNRPMAEADYPALQALARELYRLYGPPVYATPGDLDWWRVNDSDPNAILNAQVWLADGALVGFAWPSRGSVDMLLHPEYPELNDTMLHWAEAHRRANASEEETPALRAWSMTSDGARNKTLLLRGYAREEEFFFFRSRPVDALLPEIALPEGYHIRHVRGEADLEQRVAVHRDAFAPSKMTVEKYRRALASPNYRPELDLVAVAPDGTFAAFALVWFDEPTLCGMFEPVGTHSAHRRLGLASAVMVEGLRRLTELGAQEAHVNTHHDSQPAIALYESLGFRELDRFYAWVKAVGNG